MRKVGMLLIAIAAGIASGGTLDAASEALTGVQAQRVIVVAADGSGQFTTIKAAWDSVPEGNKIPTLVSIRNGVYDERLLLRNKSFVTFRGEDRQKTRIEYEFATSKVCAKADDEFGCAAVYLTEVRDLAFDNLTIDNTWRGSGKAIALRANKSTRIVFRDVDMPSTEGDTLYMEGNGLYYLSRVFISGTYHIIVPRATTWVSDSTFKCLGHRTCLFNEGTADEAQKLVIRNSSIEGDPGFGLGSYFRDAAWYFIDVKFSANMLDAPIWRDPKPNYVMRWGDRIYFAGSSGPGYAWLKDNIANSPARSKDRVTLDWVFPDWNPGNSLVRSADGQQNVGAHRLTDSLLGVR